MKAKKTNEELFLDNNNRELFCKFAEPALSTNHDQAGFVPALGLMCLVMIEGDVNEIKL